MMNNTSETNSQKRGRGRPKKIQLQVELTDASALKTSGIPGFIEPTIHDINDELAMLDSYAYSRYNN